jgi:hypothetical protein
VNWIQEVQAEPKGDSYEEHNKLINTAILIEFYLLCECSVVSFSARIMILAVPSSMCFIHSFIHLLKFHKILKVNTTSEYRNRQKRITQAHLANETKQLSKKQIYSKQNSLKSNR